MRERRTVIISLTVDLERDSKADPWTASVHPFPHARARGTTEDDAVTQVTPHALRELASTIEERGQPLPAERFYILRAT